MKNLASQLATALAGRYRIERELGHGGMATVYLAQDLKHDRPVAVKVLHPELAHALGPERFLREITFTAQFDHPYILPLLDSGAVEPPADGGRSLLYYVMPYVVGESLRDRMTRQKQLPVDDALQVAREVAEALSYAHARGVIHRDIKPENIMVSGGHARVADFGIARAIDAAGSERLTETGLAVGTPAYMSPEQSMAERDVDGRSDLYALGSVLYEMLAGEPPYTGPTAHAILAKRMTNPAPSVRTIRETVPESVDRALSRVLAKAPADRFPTATQFAEALGAPATTAPVAVGGRDRKHRTLVVGGTVLGALVLLGGGLFAHSRRSPVVPSAAVIAVLPFRPSSPDSALARLGRDLALTVSANLDGVGVIRAADSRRVLEADEAKPGRSTGDAIALGKRLGAGSVVVGDLVRMGANVRLDLRLMATTGDSSPLARVSLTGLPDSITALTDSVTWALLRQVWRRGEAPSPSYANLTTRSVASLRAFLDGERLSEAGRWAEARDAFAAAIKADSTFWLAGWRYVSALSWIGHDDSDPDLKLAYESHLEAFGERDRLLIEADRADSLSMRAFISRFKALVDRFPADWTVWTAYADLIYHSGPEVGYTNTEVRAALQRAVDLNPKLVAYWEHLREASTGHDSAQAAVAIRSLRSLGRSAELSKSWGFDVDLMNRLLLADPGHSAPLRDSLVAGIARAKGGPGFSIGMPRVFLHLSGFPVAQVELNRRLLALVPRVPFAAGLAWAAMGQSWAARGAWDSALIALDSSAATGFSSASADKLYSIAAAGAWLGALDTSRAVGRRKAAMKQLASMAREESPPARDARARVAWADGILALLRRDAGALRAARVAVRQSGADGAQFIERSLAGLELELAGAKGQAAESLVALNLAATAAEHFAYREPFVSSINHLAASRLLLEQGDTTRAVQLLFWHDADLGALPIRGAFQVFAPIAYYQLARIEEAQGKNDLARDHYGQFLRRYDTPSPEHRYMVDSANAALKRMPRQGDPPAPR